MTGPTSPGLRQTSQAPMPARLDPNGVGDGYRLYPAYPLGPDLIHAGFSSLARHLAGQRRVVIDGYAGILWEDLRRDLDGAFHALGVRAVWQSVDAALRSPREIAERAAPFLGGDDPLFGTRFPGELLDFFDPARLRALRPAGDAGVSILYGCGAALAGWDAHLVYADLPKNELQFRARAGQPTNVGCSEPLDPRAAYNRSYFVDWPALNRHKAALLARMDTVVDGQRPDEPTWARGDTVRQALTRVARTAFRVRPWFEPGPWGGQWIKEHVPELPQDVPNYAWSFELITPENGLVFESGGTLLEVSFDTLMVQEGRAVLGEAAPRFGHEFPIRFDFLDTVRGGNLSLQCHPRPGYIREHFGETFTQDETYYILDAEPHAGVYLGFQEGVDPGELRAALERSEGRGEALDVERYVQRLPAARHDLFLIPGGTVHCAGAGSLVLEISATPYIFTFKLYDWLRLDLQGRPRPLNIARAFENLRFDRAGERVRAELVSRPRLLDAGEGWRLVHLPTHEEHFYDVHRLEFGDRVDVPTGGSAHVLSLVEGGRVLLETEGGFRQECRYAETFVVPAAAGSYRLTNAGAGEAKVIKAFVKPGRGP